MVAKCYVEGVVPTLASALLKKVKMAMANTTDEVDVDALNFELKGMEMADGEEDNDEEDTDFDVADTISKALALVTQV